MSRVKYIQVWAYHQTRDEGGTATHLADPDTETPICGVRTKMAGFGEEKEFNLDAKLALTDCGNCWRIAVARDRRARMTPPFLAEGERVRVISRRSCLFGEVGTVTRGQVDKYLCCDVQLDSREPRMLFMVHELERIAT